MDYNSYLMENGGVGDRLGAIQRNIEAERNYQLSGLQAKDQLEVGAEEGDAKKEADEGMLAGLGGLSYGKAYSYAKGKIADRVKRIVKDKIQQKVDELKAQKAQRQQGGEEGDEELDEPELNEVGGSPATAQARRQPELDLDALQNEDQLGGVHDNLEARYNNMDEDAQGRVDDAVANDPEFNPDADSFAENVNNTGVVDEHIRDQEANPETRFNDPDLQPSTFRETDGGNADAGGDFGQDNAFRDAGTTDFAGADDIFGAETQGAVAPAQPQVQAPAVDEAPRANVGDITTTRPAEAPDRDFGTDPFQRGMVEGGDELGEGGIGGLRSLGSQVVRFNRPQAPDGTANPTQPQPQANLDQEAQVRQPQSADTMTDATSNVQNQVSDTMDGVSDQLSAGAKSITEEGMSQLRGLGVDLGDLTADDIGTGLAGAVSGKLGESLGGELAEGIGSKILGGLGSAMEFLGPIGDIVGIGMTLASLFKEGDAEDDAYQKANQIQGVVNHLNDMGGMSFGSLASAPMDTSQFRSGGATLNF